MHGDDDGKVRKSVHDLVLEHLRKYPGSTTKQMAFALARDFDVKDGTLRATIMKMLHGREIIRVPATYRINDP